MPEQFSFKRGIKSLYRKVCTEIGTTSKYDGGHRTVQNYSSSVVSIIFVHKTTPNFHLNDLREFTHTVTRENIPKTKEFKFKQKKILFTKQHCISG